MLAYPLSEAESMLDDKLSGAEQSLQNCEEDLEFLREQITVSSDELILAFGFSLTHTHFVDIGGRHSSRVQLGCCATT